MLCLQYVDIKYFIRKFKVVEKLLTVRNRAGIHARPASLLVQTASKFKSKIQIKAKGKTVDAKSILMIMSMGLVRGTEITFCADGSDEAEAVSTLIALIDRFNESERTGQTGRTNTQEQNVQEQMPMMKPDNHMALAIFTTICCCLPLGIVAIVKANSVNSLYMMKQYQAAVMASNEAKKWSMIGIVISFVVWLIYIVCFGGLAVLASFASQS